MGRRIFYLDAVRAFAMVTILFSHSCASMLPGSAPWWMPFIGSASLFFMTSGALILPLREAFWPFLKRRLKSFLPQFLVWSVVYALLAYADPDVDYQLKFHTIWFAYAPTWGVGWFIYALIGLYLVTPILSPWVERATQRQVELVLCVWLLSGFTYFAALHVDFRPEQSLFAPFYSSVGYLLAGYYLHRWPLRQRTRRQRLLFWGVTVLLGVVLGLKMVQLGLRYGYWEDFYQDMSVNVMAANLMVYGIFTYVKRAPRLVERIITLISVNSLNIYLCHTLVISKIVEPLELNVWGTAALTLVLSISIGWALGRVKIWGK